jgi:hypothetical protein
MAGELSITSFVVTFFTFHKFLFVIRDAKGEFAVQVSPLKVLQGGQRLSSSQALL